jgi:hypothetical protein
MEKLAVVLDAMNLMNELFSIPKQLPNPDPGQSCMVLPLVVPQSPLKSHTEVAFAQVEVVGKVVAHAGIGGGAGAGVLVKVRLTLVTVPVLAAFLLSCTQTDQLPLAFCPLLTAPKKPSGLNMPVNGAVPAFIGVAAVAVKQVPV